MFALRQRVLGPAASLAKRSLRSNFSVAPQAAPLRFSTHTSLAIAAPEVPVVVLSTSHALASSRMVTNTLFQTTSNWWIMLRNNFQETGIYMISTLKRRRKMMNKHKLRKRRKKNRMKNKK
uniref:Ribosomal protein mS38 C-terminal domain-containing protein n=1 Tax=Pseudo-nitzschia arenysensis TaxID=697910 RepID=A0A7S0F7U1_9STRA|mmetsp:Transcript_52/g.123  ORF Transcript_52/g.123 Transcript_52/m.123 type:complete len:121 (+) Transcript_52:107-469(+)